MSDEMKGKLENMKGRVKQAAGSLSGDKKLEAEGAVDRVSGAAKEKVEEIKRKLDEKRNKANDEDEDEEKDEVV
jgi:uncharacterized protein YjbJ (UPF0337 family)